MTKRILALLISASLLPTHTWAGAWSTLAKEPAWLGSAGIFSQLGAKDPAMALALGGVLDRLAQDKPDLAPSELLSLDSSSLRKQRVSSALQQYTVDLIQRSDGKEKDAEKLDREFSQLRGIIGLLPMPLGLQVLDRSHEIRKLLDEKKSERAVRSIEQLRASWNLNTPPSSEAWADFQGIVDASFVKSDFRSKVDQMLISRQEAFQEAKDSPNLSMLQRPLARIFIGRREKQNQLRRWMLAQASSPEQAIHPPSSKQRALFLALQPYAPGLNPDRVTIGDEGLLEYLDGGGISGGWATLNNHSLVAVAPGFDRLKLIEVLLHEAFHQGDHGYARAMQALYLLLGQNAGNSLYTILIEGYTQYRTQEALLSMLRLGYQGKRRGIEREAVALVEKQYGTADYESSAEALKKEFAQDPYAPFVKFVERLLREEGGQQALEKLVSQGDISALVHGLGPQRWARIGKLADVYAGSSHSKNKTLRHLAAASGLGAWIVSKMEEVMDGKLDSAEKVRRIKRNAEVFLFSAKEALACLSPRRRLAILDAFKGFDFEITQDKSLEIARRLGASRLGRIAVGRILQISILGLYTCLFFTLSLSAGFFCLITGLLFIHLRPVYISARGDMSYMLRFLPRDRVVP